MKNWIEGPVTLIGETVDLITLEESHFVELQSIAEDQNIWEYYPMDLSITEKFFNVYRNSLIERANGNCFPFSIWHKSDQKIIGSSRFMDIQLKHKKLEIGFTWLHQKYWATEVNLECKLLLLTYCFETLMTSRVQLKTDENNIRSRKAIQKIGGQYEGLLRNDMIRENGTKRNSAYYSIIEEEWPEKKERLSELLIKKKRTGG